MFPLQTELFLREDFLLSPFRHLGNKTGDFSHEGLQRLLANKLPIGTVGSFDCCQLRGHLHFMRCVAKINNNQNKIIFKK